MTMTIVAVVAVVVVVVVDDDDDDDDNDNDNKNKNKNNNRIEIEETSSLHGLRKGDPSTSSSEVADYVPQHIHCINRNIFYSFLKTIQQHGQGPLTHTLVEAPITRIRPVK